MRRTFKKAVQLVLEKNQGEGRDKRSLHHAMKLKKTDDDLVTDLTKQMERMDVELIRKIRAVTDDMKIEASSMGSESDKCQVQNMTCVKFPTMKQCHGISFGGCICKSSGT